MSEPVNDGGPAFPLATIDGYVTAGMTLRDYFAAQAISALIPMVIEETVKTGRPQVGVAVEMAYSMADAMIKERGL